MTMKTSAITPTTLTPTIKTSETPIKSSNPQEQKVSYPLYPGAVLHVEPSHLWLQRLATSNVSPVAETIRSNLKKEILLDKNAPDFADRLIDTWQKYGFAVVQDKDFDSQSVQEAYKIMRSFFAKDISYKSQLGSLGPNNNDGYIPPDTEISVSAIGSSEIRSQANVFEIIHRTADGKNKNIDDELGKEFQGLTDALVNILHAQAKDIGKAMAIGLRNKGFLTPEGKELNDDYFVKLMHVEPEEINDLNLMRLTHCKAYELEEGSSFSCTLAHTDLNFASLLPTATKAGLEIWYEDTEHPENTGWVQLDAPKDAYIVNLADQADILTRGYLKSTPHRVISPIGEDRYSIIFFAGFNRNIDLIKAKLTHPLYTGSSRFEQESLPRIKDGNLTALSFTNLRRLDIGVFPESENFIPIKDLEYMKGSQK